MSHHHRRPLRIGAATSLIALGLALGSALAAAPALAQDRGVTAGPYGGYDDDRLYQDENGNLFRRRAGAYVPYRGRVMHGRPVPDLAVDVDPDAQAYARRRTERGGEPVAPGAADEPIATGRPAPAAKIDDGPIDYARAYGPVDGEPFPVQPFNWKKANPSFLRQEVAYNGPEAPGTIIVDPRAHHLLLVQPNGRARRYGVGVGKQGFSWSGASTVNSKQAWPDWYPPKEMIARTPKLAREVSQLQSGLGVPGGSRNPLGARAMYLWQNNKDTLFRIHGTTDPSSIGRSVSSGCIRMINQDAIDLFNRVEVGAKVVVLG